MNKSFLWLGLFFVIAFTGCATIESQTLPANKKTVYEFPAYDLKPLDTQVWRFGQENRQLQSVQFFHSRNNALITFWIRPIFSHDTEKNTQDDIVVYFQNKFLKDLKLSPDIKLEEQNIVRSTQKINNKEYQVMHLTYAYNKKDFESYFYYYADNNNKILYTFALWFENTKNATPGFEKDLMTDLHAYIDRITFKNPTSKDMIQLRVDYAFSDFSESAKDKYLQSNKERLQARFDNAVSELNDWLKFKSNNSRAFCYLGYMASYNTHFEEFGEGFDKVKTEEFFRKAIEIRPYYKEAHVALARLYKNTKRFDDAIREYETATTISPNDENLYYEIGKIYEDLDQKDKAKPYYEKAIRYWGNGTATLTELKNKLKTWK